MNTKILLLFFTAVFFAAGEDKNNLYIMRTPIASANIPERNIRSIDDGKLYIDKVSMEGDYKHNTDFSVEIDGKLLNMTSEIFTHGSKTGYIVRTADIAKDTAIFDSERDLQPKNYL